MQHAGHESIQEVMRRFLKKSSNGLEKPPEDEGKEETKPGLGEGMETFLEGCVVWRSFLILWLGRVM